VPTGSTFESPNLKIGTILLSRKKSPMTSRHTTKVTHPRIPHLSHAQELGKRKREEDADASEQVIRLQIELKKVKGEMALMRTEMRIDRLLSYAQAEGIRLLITVTVTCIIFQPFFHFRQ
jgi:hypothetical protein